MNLLNNLGKGHREFSDLNEEEKMILYTSQVDISQFVDEEEIREFERKHTLLTPPEGETQTIESLVERFLGFKGKIIGD